MTRAAVGVPVWDDLVELGLISGRAVASHGAAACPLSPRRESVKLARAFTEETLERWGLADLFDLAALVVSELVTNALVHGFPRRAVDRCDALPYEDGYSIHLGLVHEGRHVVCAVTDPSDAAPIACEADQDAETGRGLYLVESFSESWGWSPLPHAESRVGKVVWAVLAAVD
jgi:hypothetical protein